MFNPFQAFQDAAKQFTQSTGQPGAPFTGTPAASNPLPGAADWAALFDPKKLFDPQTYRDMFPKELTQAWQSFSSNTWAQALQSPLQQTMQQGAQQGAQTVPQSTPFNAQTATTASAFPKGFDFSALAAAQQKNMDTLNRAQAAAVNGWQSLVKRQAEIFHDTLQAAATAMNELMAAGAPEDKLARQADLAKQAFESAGRNVEELSKLAANGQQEAMKVVSARVQESLDEIKRAAQTLPQKAAQGMQQGMNQAANSFAQGLQTVQQTATAASDTVRQNLNAASDAVG